MITRNIAFRLLTTTVLLGSVVVAGSAMAKPADGETTIASAASAAGPVPATVAVTAPVAMSETSGCARKVKVVYAGYGEAARAACVTTSNAAAN